MGEQFQIDMNDFLPLRDVVFNTLRKAILTGQLKPGERLMEVHLANQLGVSRTPIREADQKTGTGRTGYYGAKAGSGSGQNHRKEFTGCAGGATCTGCLKRRTCL